MKIFLSAAALALVAISAAPAIAAGKITIAIGGSDKIVYLPATLAERLGYFRAQGLEVELRSEMAGIEAKDALLSGAVQGVVGFYDHTIALQAKGKLVQSVVQFTVSPGEAALVSAKMADAIRSPAGFKGRNVGVTGLGASTSFLIHYLALAHGVKPNEINVVPVGAGDRFMSAMRESAIDAGMTTEPTISRLLKTGEAKILVDLRMPQDTVRVLGGLYPAACLYMRTSWIGVHRSEVQSLVSALVRALAYIRTHSADEIASAMPAQYHGDDRSLYVNAIAASKAMFTDEGRMPASGPGTVLKVMAAIDHNVQDKNIDLSKTYTTQFVAAASRQTSLSAANAP
jgi:NitT/TauT family transport system substrate-binding protein